VSVASGIWCGTAVLTSFFFDLLFDPHGGVNNLPLALVALALLMAGICGIAYAGQLSDGEDETATLLGNEAEGPGEPAERFAGTVWFKRMHHWFRDDCFQYHTRAGFATSINRRSLFQKNRHFLLRWPKSESDRQSEKRLKPLPAPLSNRD
jgi:hypothetical protein